MNGLKQQSESLDDDIPRIPLDMLEGVGRVSTDKPAS